MNGEMRLCSVNLKNGAVNCFERLCLRDLCEEVRQSYGVSFENYYVIKDGKKVGQDEIVDGLLHLVPRLVGGKGGFGSMLRAIGAQIEKTTNREACRDLSGRRLRDINEEQRLKNWIAQQAEREREAAERKKKKIERLCKEPKHDFKDEIYEKERSELTDKVSSSVEEGFRKAGTSGTSNQLKRTHTVTSATVKKKKKKLWIDADDLSSSDSDDCDTVNINNDQKDRTELEKAEGQSTS